MEPIPAVDEKPTGLGMAEDVKPAVGDGLQGWEGAAASAALVNGSSVKVEEDVKPALNGDTMAAAHDACPPSPSAATKTANSTSTSAASTPAPPNGSESPVTSRKKAGRPPQVKKEKVKKEIQYIHDLPESTDEARSTFVEMEESWYQNKSIGRTKQQEDSMVCDCTWSPGEPPEMACSEASGCINYLTQVECIESECRCHTACQNQRFGRRQYAPIEIVKTEKKGFGVRAAGDIAGDAFVYEYVGEIVGEKAFQKRMKDYADEGLQHFYFMQLQKDEYIDATKKGGLGRFLNHSCSPNCYIAKWVVGRYLRMGIFTKRKINKGEELTFNYNVDRYGHEPQVCHCGEPNCVGFLGGKTQTDVGAMDDLYLDALGIMDDVEAMSLKGTKSKKGKKMDIDYIPIMKPIPLKDVPKVASAIRQSCTNRRILSKLIQRIQITDDEAVRRQLMRLHGFSLMSMVMNEYMDDEQIVKTVIEILLTWPLITKNKLISTNIEDTIIKLGKEGSEGVRELATKLSLMWVDLEVSYRIPRGTSASDAKRRLEEEVWSDRDIKRQHRDSVSLVPEQKSQTVFVELPRTKDPRLVDAWAPKTLPPGWVEEDRPQRGRTVWCYTETDHRQFTYPSQNDTLIQLKIAYDKKQAELAKSRAVDLKDIVARAREEAEKAEAEAAARAEAERLKAEKEKAEKEAKRERAKKRAEEKKKKAKQDGQSRDKKILRLFSEVVVRVMSRYRGALDHDQFKKRAREVTDILCQKEKKSSSYATDPYEKLSPEKEAKVKAFVKDWTAKLLARKGLATPASSSSSSSHSRRPSSASMGGSSSSVARADSGTPLTPATSDASGRPQASPSASRHGSRPSIDNGDSLYDDLDEGVEVNDADILEEMSDDEMIDGTAALPTPKSGGAEAMSDIDGVPTADVDGEPIATSVPPTRRLSGTPPDLPPP